MRRIVPPTLLTLAEGHHNRRSRGGTLHVSGFVFVAGKAVAEPEDAGVAISMISEPAEGISLGKGVGC